MKVVSSILGFILIGVLIFVIVKGLIGIINSLKNRNKPKKPEEDKINGEPESADTGTVKEEDKK